MPVKFSSKHLKFALTAGLTGLALYLMPKNRFLMKAVLAASRYRALSKYVVAHAKTETDDFTSAFYSDLHNMFGMKTAVKRRQLGRPSSRFESDGGTAMRLYANDIQSLRDLFLYFDYVDFPTYVESPERYVRELKSRGYFTIAEATYLSLLKANMA